MNPASPAPLLFWLVGFWVAVAVHARRSPDGEGSLRLPIGLALGALLAHLGWAILHLDEVSRHPLALLDVSTGMSVLFVPLGLLLVALPAPRDERRRFLAAALGSLPLALAMARVGCVVAGCCHGITSDVAWALPLGPDEQMRHPTALYEIAGLLGLATAVHLLPAGLTASAVLVGMGALRLMLEPLRSPPPLGEPVVSVSLVAAGCVVTGLLLARPLEPGGRGERAGRGPRSEPTTAESATADGRRRGADEQGIRTLAERLLPGEGGRDVSSPR